MNKKTDVFRLIYTIIHKTEPKVRRKSRTHRREATFSDSAGFHDKSRTDAAKIRSLFRAVLRFSIAFFYCIAKAKKCPYKILRHAGDSKEKCI